MASQVKAALHGDSKHKICREVPQEQWQWPGIEARHTRSMSIIESLHYVAGSWADRFASRQDSTDDTSVWQTAGFYR